MVATGEIQVAFGPGGRQWRCRRGLYAGSAAIDSSAASASSAIRRSSSRSGRFDLPMVVLTNGPVAPFGGERRVRFGRAGHRRCDGHVGHHLVGQHDHESPVRGSGAQNDGAHAGLAAVTWVVRAAGSDPAPDEAIGPIEQQDPAAGPVCPAVPRAGPSSCPGTGCPAYQGHLPNQESAHRAPHGIGSESRSDVMMQGRLE